MNSHYSFNPASPFPVAMLQEQPTPLYYYDLSLLERTLDDIAAASAYPGFLVHYAVKANANHEILKVIASHGLGADIVSGGEIQAALADGFDPSKMAYAGVGKADWEIELALRQGIGCLNVESAAELEVISGIARSMGKVATIALRVNPNIDAHTHHYITTGLAENKFGIDLSHLDDVVRQAVEDPAIDLAGLHFHIGSQVTITEPFKLLCQRILDIQEHFRKQGVEFRSINVGGGLGIDYDDPDAHPIPDFKAYFDTFRRYLPLHEGQQLHFELGRSVVAQCGSLITRVLYVKQGVDKRFCIVDAGMTELIRPALYQAHHVIQNITSPNAPVEKYDVVGPICESSDVFAADEPLPATHRGDLLAIRSAGAYGEAMASHYNCRQSNSPVYNR